MIINIEEQSEDSSSSSEEGPELIEFNHDQENSELICRGEPIPQKYEDRMGFIYRRHAGRLS